MPTHEQSTGGLGNAMGVLVNATITRSNRRALIQWLMRYRELSILRSVFASRIDQATHGVQLQ